MNNRIQGEKYRFTVLTNQLIRMEYSETGYFEDGLTQIVRNREFPEATFEVIETEGKLEIITESLHLHYKKGPFTPENLFIDARNNFSFYGNRWHYGEEVPTLQGTAQTLDHADGEIELGEGIISKNGFAILDDSTSFLLNEGEEPRFRPEKSIDLYFFSHGRDYLGALKDYYTLSGFTPLLPRYALGNWWSRFWKYTEESYIALMDKFEEEKVPLAVSVIDMDWHIREVPERFGSGWTGYTWNKDFFPNPQRFLERLHEKNLKVTLNVHPADGIRAFEEMYPKVAEKLELDQEKEQPALFDISDATFRNVYFEDIHHSLEAQGVDFWWIDWQQGIKGELSTVDPLWLLNYYHYQDISRKGQHDIILSRFAGPGSHRYPIGFSGDTIVTWESLDFQPYFTSTASNIGYTWWSHDIGGHMNGYHDEELALRWYQLGVFSPINRLHSSPSLFSGKEPWSFSPQTNQIMKKFLHLRHELLPYLYTMNVKTHEEGVPLVMPLYYLYAMEKESYQYKNQYLFGSELMVAPITRPTDSKYKTAGVDVWFPEGTWYDFFNDVAYKGDTQLRIYRKREQMPVFVKAGGIVPLDKEPALTGTALPETIDWHIFPGASNVFELIEDEENKRAKTTLQLDWENQTIQLLLEGDTTVFPEKREHRLIFHCMENQSVTLSNNSQKISVAFKENMDNREDTRLFDCLSDAEIEYKEKNALWAYLNTEIDFSKKMAYLDSVDASLRSRIFEIMYTTNN